MFRVLIAFLALGSLAHADAHRVNIYPVRTFIENKLVDHSANRLKLGAQLDEKHPGKGISAAAVKKAKLTAQGLNGFAAKGEDVKARNYVVKMGKEKLLITAQSTPIYSDAYYHLGTASRGQRFVARTGKNGLVVARGFVKNGKVTWTRSKNGGNPIERNDAE